MIDPYVQKLLDQDGFIERYWDFVVMYPTCRQAYEAVERQYELNFGRRKYADYGVFKNILSRWNKKKTAK
jgi:hypothetical protein